MSQRLRRERAAIPRRNLWKLAGFMMAGVFGAVLVAGLIGFLLILHTTSSPIIHTDPAAARRLQQELENAQTAATSGTQEVVRADETEINSLLKEYLQGSTSTPSAGNVAVVRDMKLNLIEDRMRLYVLANVRGKDLSLFLEGQLRTLNGYLDFQPISGKIGSLPIPKRSLKRAMDQMISTPESHQSMHLPANLRDLHIESGRLVVTFR